MEIPDEKKFIGQLMNLKMFYKPLKLNEKVIKIYDIFENNLISKLKVDFFLEGMSQERALKVKNIIIAAKDFIFSCGTDPETDKNRKTEFIF